MKGPQIIGRKFKDRSNMFSSTFSKWGGEHTRKAGRQGSMLDTNP